MKKGCSSTSSVDLTQEDEPERKQLKLHNAKADQTKAQIIWALYTVYTTSSYSSTDIATNCFKATGMFSDSCIAANFELSRIKLSYVISFGIADYLKLK